MSWGAFDPKTLTAKQLEQAAKTLSAMSEADLQRMLSSLTPEQKEHMRKNGINPSMIEKVVTTVKEDPATLKRAQDLMKNMSGEQLLDAKRMAEQVSRMADAREREGAGDGASNPREELRAMSKRELRLAAEKLGVADGAVDQFRDDEMAKDEFIELVVSKMPTDPAANAAMPDGENLRREVGVSGDHWTRPLQAVTIPVIEIEKTEKLARYRAEAEAMPMRDLQRALSEMDVDCSSYFEKSELAEAFARAKLGKH